MLWNEAVQKLQAVEGLDPVPPPAAMKRLVAAAELVERVHDALAVAAPHSKHWVCFEQGRDMSRGRGWHGRLRTHNATRSR